MTKKIKLFIARQIRLAKTKLKSKKLERQIFLDSAETFAKHLQLTNDAIVLLEDRIFKLENEDEYNN
tara:strand:- start:245 stop:445 length:201 start_codon:yes stop_codon:yes gene_type:complete